MTDDEKINEAFAAYLGTINQTEEMWRKDNTKRAEDAARFDLLLNAVAQAEKISVSEAELASLMRDIAEATGLELENVMAVVEPQPLREQLYARQGTRADRFLGKGGLDMKTVALFGAGQIGAMVSRLLGTGCGACCFADNSEEKWGSELAGIPIVSPRDALLFDPDAVCICVLDDERAAQMCSQLDALGYDGEIISPALLKTFDARSAQMRLIARAR